MLSEGDSRDQESKSIYDDPLPFNCQSIKEQFERQQKGGSRTQRKSLSNFRYDSMNYVDGQYRDAQAKEGDAWNPRVHQAWGPNSRGSKVQRQRFGRGQRKYQHICLWVVISLQFICYFRTAVEVLKHYHCIKIKFLCTKQLNNPNI